MRIGRIVVVDDGFYGGRNCCRGKCKCTKQHINGGRIVVMDNMNGEMTIWTELFSSFCAVFSTFEYVPHLRRQDPHLRRQDPHFGERFLIFGERFLIFGDKVLILGEECLVHVQRTTLYLRRKPFISQLRLLLQKHSIHTELIEIKCTTTTQNKLLIYLKKGEIGGKKSVGPGSCWAF